MTLHQSRVVIIGAGLAGLSAASKLLSKLHDENHIYVLESSERIGGRVHSVDLVFEKGVELGAQWIHGQDGNVVHEIAKAQSMTDETFAGRLEELETLVIDEDGSFWSSEIVEELYEAFLSFEEESYKTTFEETSIGSYIDEKLKKYLDGRSEDFVSFASRYKDIAHRHHQTLDACNDWYNLSAWGSCNLFHINEGDQMVVLKPQYSFKDILELFSFPKSRIQTEAHVEYLEYDSETKRTTLYLTHGVRIVAEFVIITCSLGFLKKYPEFIRPISLLSSKKIKALETIGFGTVDKINMEFDEPWWNKELDIEIEGFEFAYDSPCDLSLKEAQTNWLRFLLGFYLVAHKPNLLSGWISGHGAREMEGFSDSKIKDTIMTFLRHRLRFKFCNIPDPISISISRWHSWKSFQGSYSYQTLESEKAGVGPSDLAEPIAEGRIRFAGEATSTHYFATTQGAVESGWREADKILNILKPSSVNASDL